LVYKCDFLTVESISSMEEYHSYKESIDNKGQRSFSQKEFSSSSGDIASPLVPMKELIKLPENYYDMIIMSLVLSYLPSSEMRESMIEKARKLLISAGSSKAPHYSGLLMIIEKHSIFHSPKQAGSLPSSTVITVDDWKSTICSKGFFLVSYQQLVTSDERKSHVFIFKTSILDDRSSSLSDAPVKPLWIKQDFNRHPLGSD
jgi:hypothetical protein